MWSSSPGGAPSSASASPSGSASPSASASPSVSPSPIVSPGSISATCPPLDVVNSTLGLQNDAGPVSAPYASGISCSYSSLGAELVTVHFRATTAAAFAQERDAINSSIQMPVTGLGDDAYGTPGTITVRKGSTEIAIIGLGVGLENGAALAQYILANP